MTGGRPVRILHVAQPVCGGVAVYVRDACADQLRRGWTVAVACPGEGALPASLDRLGIVRFAWEASRSPSVRTVAEALRLRRIVRHFRPDVVHLHSAKAGLAGRLPVPGGAGGSLIAFQPHGWSWLAAEGRMARASRWWERIAARRTDLLICVGQGEAAQGEAAGIATAVQVVRNGVDLERHRPPDAAVRAHARRRFGLAEDEPVAVCVGRLTRQKGQDILLKAWPAVTARCPRARLFIVGDGEDLPRLRDLGGAGVSFVPAVADPRPWYAVADVVVLPSRWEGLPLTALEALAAGRSVVASDIPGLAEVVPPRVGTLVPPGDEAALGDALVARLAQPDLAAGEGGAARDYARVFDVTQTFEQLAAAIEGLVHPAPAQTGGHLASVAGSGGGEVGAGTG